MSNLLISVGQCLRTVATAARALALSLDAPLVCVNHCVFPADAGFAGGRVKHGFIQWVGQNSNPAAIYPDFRWCGMGGALIKTTNWRL